MLQVNLLGRFQVVCDETEVPAGVWTTQGVAATLFKLLALEPEHRLSRSRAIDVLWGAKAIEKGDKGRGDLSRTISELRRILRDYPCGVTILDGGAGIVLHPVTAVAVDALQFEQRADAIHAARRTAPLAALEEAAALYHGELLPDDTAADWTHAPRVALHLQQIDILLELGERRLASGEVDGGVKALRQALRYDSTLEDAHVAIMTAYARAGRADAARRQYEIYARAMAEDELPVAPEVAALLEQIGRGQLTPGRRLVHLVQHLGGRAPAGSATTRLDPRLLPAAVRLDGPPAAAAPAEHALVAAELVDPVPVVAGRPREQRRRRWYLIAGAIGALLALAVLAAFAWLPPDLPPGGSWYVSLGPDIAGLKTAPDGRLYVETNTPITATLHVRNAGLTLRALAGIALGVRHPTDCTQVWAGRSWDFPPDLRKLRVPPGEEVVYQHAWTLSEPGVYFAEPLELGIDGVWGGILPFPRVWFTVVDRETGRWPDRGCLPASSR